MVVIMTRTEAVKQLQKAVDLLDNLDLDSEDHILQFKVDNNLIEAMTYISDTIFILGDDDDCN